MMNGVLFCMAAWLGIMVMVTQMPGAGLSGMAFLLIAPMMTLVLHIVIAPVLGAAYQAQAKPAFA